MAIKVISSDMYITSLRVSIYGTFITKKYNATKNTVTDNIKENNFMLTYL